MRTVVTGAAGFIGSSLVDALLDRGDEVLAVDCFTPYYDEAVKRGNLERALGSPRFRLAEVDLRGADVQDLLHGADCVFHLAAQPGVRSSWSAFESYTDSNVLATQRLLEAACDTGVPRFVFASSSSIYGRAPTYPTREDDLPAPHSPYGVTKLAAEHLCTLYAANRGLSTVCLRYFTVFGPRQRPDMAIHRMLVAGLRSMPFPLYGDGSAVRDFTFVDDVVRANLAAAAADVAPGAVVNIAGGSEISMRDLRERAAEAVGAPIAVAAQPAQLGDVVRTGGCIDRARELLGWEPYVPLEEGLKLQVEWHRAVETP